MEIVNMQACTLLFLMSLGRTNAPEPRRMERSFVCSLRMRCASELATIFGESVVSECLERGCCCCCDIAILPALCTCK